MKVNTHNSRGTNGIEYSTHFSLSLVILQQNMYQGVVPQGIIYVREKNAIYSPSSQNQSLRIYLFDLVSCFVYLRPQIYSFVAKN